MTFLRHGSAIQWRGGIATGGSLCAVHPTPGTYMHVQSGAYGLRGGIGFYKQTLSTPSGPPSTEV